MSKYLNNGLTNVKGEIKTLKRQFSDVVKSGENKGDQKRELNIVIRILSESQHENVNTKVNGLLKDGLKLREITVLNVIRKPARKHYQSGLIIATCKRRST